jgi:hypothetical protein
MYFDAETAQEAELREIADELYRRIDWRWSQHGGKTIMQGWKPESGFLHYGWEGYSESIILYVLALGSPTHPPGPDIYKAWTATYQWENLYDIDFLYGGPLFMHQFSHAWIDFRGIRDRFMRDKRSDYFENSRRAVLVQREYVRRNPHEFIGYDEECWGLPHVTGRAPEIRTRSKPTATVRIRGARRALLARTTERSRVGGSGLAAVRAGDRPDDHANDGSTYPEMCPDHRYASGFNPGLVDGDGKFWVSPGHYGLDQGIVAMMIENHRTQLIWRLMRNCAYIVTDSDVRGSPAVGCSGASMNATPMRQQRGDGILADEAAERERMDNRPSRRLAQSAAGAAVRPRGHRRRHDRAGRGAHRRGERREGGTDRASSAWRHLPQHRLRALEGDHPHLTRLRGDASCRPVRRARSAPHSGRFCIGNAAGTGYPGAHQPSGFGAAADGGGRGCLLRPGCFAGVDALTVEGTTLRFKRAVIATGARPDLPSIPGLAEAGFLTNENAFDVSEAPRRLLVIGGGPLGCEMAQAFGRFGVRTIIVQKQPLFLPREERDAAQILSEAFMRDGIEVRLNTRVVNVRTEGGQKIVDLVSDDYAVRSRSMHPHRHRPCSQYRWTRVGGRRNRVRHPPRRPCR